MLTVLGLTGPIFLIIALGFIATHAGLIHQKDSRALGAFVINFALPALLFRAVSQKPLAQMLDVELLTRYALGSFIVVIMGMGIAWLSKQNRKLQTATMFGMGMSLSNSAFMGFPIAEQLIGPAASTSLAVYVTVENMIMVPVLLCLAELGRKSGSHWGRVLHGIFMRLVRNPLILSMIAGVSCSLFEITLPMPVARTLDLLAGSSAPVALFYIGCILAGLSLKGMGWNIGRIAFGKLILHPLAIFMAFMIFPFNDSELEQAAIINASMPMATIYPLLGQKYGYEGLCAAALVATTACSFLTINGLIWLFQNVG